MTATKPEPTAIPKLTFHQRMVAAVHTAAAGRLHTTIAEVREHCARLTEPQVRAALGTLADLGLIYREKAPAKAGEPS